MILATRTLDGKTEYVDAFSGRKVSLERMLGVGQSRLPDYALRYLKPGMKTTPETTHAQPKLNRAELRQEQRKTNQKPKQPGWWTRAWNWIKNRFNG